jgi:hypothetical protein
MASFMIRTAPFATPSGGFQTNLSGEQDEKAKALLKSFTEWRKSDDDEEEKTVAFATIQDLSWSLFTTNHKKNSESEFNDPVIQFLLSYFLKPNGQVMHAGNITPQLSKMQYVMRMTYFAHCHNQSVERNMPILE